MTWAMTAIGLMLAMPAAATSVYQQARYDLDIGAETFSDSQESDDPGTLVRVTAGGGDGALAYATGANARVRAAFNGAPGAGSYNFQSVAGSNRVVTASADAAARVNIYQDRTMAVAVPDTSDWLSWLPDVGTDFVGREPVALAIAAGNGVVTLSDLDTGARHDFAIVSQARFDAARVRDSPGAPLRLETRLSVISLTASLLDGAVTEQTTLVQTDGASRLSLAGSQGFDMTFRAGGSYALTIQSSCTARGLGVPAFLAVGIRGIPAVGGLCDLLAGTIWDGITGADGAPLPGFRLIGEDGIDYAFSSAGVPAPANPAPVPEPASWLLLIAGFALTGGVLRRQRSAPAGCCAGGDRLDKRATKA